MATPMTPQEMHDAWTALLNGGDRTGYERMLDQLWWGVLVMESVDDGYVFRAGTDAEQAERAGRAPRSRFIG